MKTERSRQRREGGNALVEFAVSFFMIFSVFTGIFQFGYAFYTYNLLVNAVREGARYASTRSYASLDTTPDRTFAVEVKNMVVYGDPDPPRGTPPVVAGLTPDKVDVTVTAGTAGGVVAVPKAVTVAVNGHIIDAVFARIPLNGKPNATFPYSGILTPGAAVR